MTRRVQRAEALAPTALLPRADAYPRLGRLLLRRHRFIFHPRCRRCHPRALSALLRAQAFFAGA